MPLSKNEQLKKNKPEKQKEPRMKKCRYCKKLNIVYGSINFFCFDKKCVDDHVKQLKEKAHRKAFNQSNRQWLTKKSQTSFKAQTAFNAYIRKRDGNICISCGNTTRQIHAGHFRPVARNAKLRFNELNCHSQCSICNNHLSGNLVPYREALIKRYGLEEVEALENDNEPYKYSIEELHEIIERYKKMTKCLDY